MTHRLERAHPLHAVAVRPMIASLRYRCQCAAGEVLQIQVVMDLDTTEEKFLWTMQQLWKDVKFEISQHLKEQK